MSYINNIATSQNFIEKPTEGSLHSKSEEALKISFTETVFASVLTSAACLFAASPYIATSLMGFTATVIAINLLARFTALFIDHLSSSSQTGFVKKFSETCKTLIPFNLALLYGSTADVLIHEGGHAAAISLVYANPKPQVKITGFFSGVTSWKTSKFTSFGKFLGFVNAQIFIAAAGALASVCIATIGIILVFQLWKNDPHLSKCFLFSSIFSITDHVTYALSALSADPNMLVHDFVKLWHFGIHPLVSAVILVAIPTIAVIGCYYNKNYLKGDFQK